MTAVSEASVALTNARGRQRGQLHIRPVAASASQASPGLLEVVDDASSPTPMASVQLLEGSEYRYSLTIEGISKDLRTDHDDMFSADDSDGRTGRLKTRSYVGYLPVTILVGNEPLGVARLEVRSRKLDYLTHYRWMLDNLTEVAVGILYERFAPSQLGFTPNELLDPSTAYERFTLLQSLLGEPILGAAFGRIIGRPHVEWRAELEGRTPSRGIPRTSMMSRELVKSGPRQEWENAWIPGLSSLPRQIDVPRTEATLDTLPNRFVKFVLNRWLTEVLALRQSISSDVTNARRERGLREIDAIHSVLSDILYEPMFAEIGELLHFPTANQVLQKAEGYRDVLRAYLQFEGASQLAWPGGNSVFFAGARNVAALYEFWAYIQLISALKRAGVNLDEAPLITLTNSGANLSLRRGEESRIDGRANRLGRQIQIELSFNRKFAGRSQSGSWTRAMQPDCSVRFRARSGAKVEEMWLHFDAKYRVDYLFQLFGNDDEGDNDEGGVEANPTQSKRDDLLKMHAYKDAISRSGGAYVIYPGSDLIRPEIFSRYHEMLPGLGAFALKPSEDGDAQGLDSLVRFLGDALTHFASVLTQDRRGRYWEGISYSLSTRTKELSGWQPSSDSPPADTIVLLGYVKSRAHLQWIRHSLLYNLRAGPREGSVGLASKELAARIVALYGRDLPEPELWLIEGEPELWTRKRLAESGYPEPGGEVYLCLRLSERVLQPEATPLTTARLRTSRTNSNPKAAWGQPVTTTWLDLLMGGESTASRQPEKLVG